jgi:predicted P-loop ATPase
MLELLPMSANQNGAAQQVDWPTIEAVFGDYANDPRWVVWRQERRRGKPTKVPYVAASGREPAKSNDPLTWRPLRTARGKCEVDGVSQPGLMLGRLEDGRWLAGFDLDLCRSPVTGAIEPWAQPIIRRLGTYGEVSPSLTGVKLIGVATSLPPQLLDGSGCKGVEATPPGAAIPEGAEGGEHTVPEVGIYPASRYFAVTGWHLPDTPDELTDVTEPLAEIAHELARWAGGSSANKGQAELERLPEPLRQVLQADSKLLAGWTSGEKLTGGGDSSGSGKDMSLVVYLARHGHEDKLLELALWHYPHGQIGSGSLTGVNAERRISRLLKEAEKARARAPRERQDAIWLGELVTTEKGAPRDCLANGGIVLRRDPAFAGKIRLNEHQQAIVCRDMPWRPGSDWREWTDSDDIRFAEWCQLRGVPLKRATAADAVAAVADDNRVHPVREYLDGLKWDGKPRLSEWLFTYLGVRVPAGAAARDTYVREVGRRWLISAVVRIFKPGCKVDAAPIFEGPQGAGKSSALAALVPKPEWFTDGIADLGTKDAAQDLRGKWIIELPELSAMRRPEVERTKAFWSRQVDHYRPSYGQRSQDFARQCVFGGTTNSDIYLADESGNRRFWPVKVGTIDLEALRRDRDMLWAESVVAFKAGERWWLDGEAEKAAAEEQAERRINDPWERPVIEWASRQTEPVAIADVLQKALEHDKSRWGRSDEMRVATLLKVHGWRRRQVRIGTSRGWVYDRPVSPTTSEVGDKVGDEKASVHAGVTNVTNVTNGSHVLGKDHHHPVCGVSGGGGGILEKIAKKVGDSAEVGDNPPPPWTDLDGWRARYRRAGNWGEKVSVVLQWGRAAGGTVQDGEARVLRLPDNLPNCFALVELRRVARDLKVLAA